jgi:hypothetical protein
MAARMAALAMQNKVPEAIETGERFLARQADPQGDVRQTLVRLYTEQGDPVSAVRHMTRAEPSPPVGASSPASPAPDQPQPPHMQATPVASGEVSVSITPNGLEARAGEANASIHK